MKHAPHAPGARPNSFWKQQRNARESRISSGKNPAPEIYTKPEPKKQGGR